MAKWGYTFKAFIIIIIIFVIIIVVVVVAIIIKSLSYLFKN